MTAHKIPDEEHTPETCSAKPGEPKSTDAVTAAAVLLSAAVANFQLAFNDCVITSGSCPLTDGGRCSHEERENTLRESCQSLLSQRTELIQKYNELVERFNELQRNHRVLLHKHTTYVNHFGECDKHKNT